MKRIRIVGLCIAAMCAVVAFTATSAFAAEETKQPEFGTCVKKAGGKFKNSGCSIAAKAATEEKFEWNKGLAKAVTFTSKIKELTSATLETVGGTKITCKTEEGSGQINAGTANKVSKVIALFKECTTSGFPCTSAGKASGEIETFNLTGGVGIEKVSLEGAAKNKAAEELHAESGTNLAEFECVGVPVEVRGSVLHNVKVNAMLSKTTEKFTQSKGKQKPEKYAGGVAKEHILESNNAKGPFEQAGQTITALVTFAEKAELNTVNGPACSLPCES